MPGDVLGAPVERSATKRLMIFAGRSNPDLGERIVAFVKSHGLD